MATDRSPAPATRLRPTTRRRRRAGLAAALLVGLLAPATIGADPAAADAPDLRSGNGITVTGVRWQSNRTLVAGISTAKISPNAVNGPHQVRITLPSDYFARPTTRYPVLYLLHGGAGGSSVQWTAGGGDAEGITAGKPIITVSPDGGKVGWYTNWINQSRGAQAWADFHLNQLVPWIDANLRTIATKQGRAVAGLSMGGYGAIRYAQDRPDLFAAAASFSGALDLEDQGVRVVIGEQSLQHGFPVDGPFGWPVWPFDTVWKAQNPLRRADRLRTVKVFLYAGSGINDVDILERTVGATSDRMHKALDAAGIAHYWWMYGRPGNGCDGGHNFGCWNFALRDALPRLLAVLSHP